MGNTVSNKYCPRHLAEKELSTVEKSEDGEENPYGPPMSKCLGGRFIATIRCPPPPSLVDDTLNLLGVKERQALPVKMTYSCGDWVSCRDFLVVGILSYYDKVNTELQEGDSVDAELQQEEYEKEKKYLSEHLDAYGWVERNYVSSKKPVESAMNDEIHIPNPTGSGQASVGTGLFRGEIISQNKFMIDLKIDRTDIRRKFGVELGPFTTSDSADAISKAFDVFMENYSPSTGTDDSSDTISESKPKFLMDASILSDIFDDEASISEIITNGHISRIIPDPPTYFTISAKYLE